MSSPALSVVQALTMIGIMWIVPAAAFAWRSVQMIQSDRSPTPQQQTDFLLGVIGAASIAMLLYAMVF